ncbi:MAG: DMT family transporter [Sphaerochaetaceae bacterium]
MEKQKVAAHIAALITVIVWGTTFIATKILLDSFSPIEILVIRFVIGYMGLALYDAVFKPNGQIRKFKFDFREEFLFGLAGLSGVVMYYMLENVALTYTYASNVGILVALAPLTTALFVLFLVKEEKVRVNFVGGFLIATVGAALVMFNGSVKLQLSLKGDLLALAATIGWAIYSITLKKIGNTGYAVSTYTRKIFFWGIIFMLPVALIMGFTINKSSFTLLNIVLLLFLGLGASASCFVSWNFAVGVLGVLKTSAYIYLTPLVSLFSAAIVLKEELTFMAIGGSLLILGGLYLSEQKRGN